MLEQCEVDAGQFAQNCQRGSPQFVLGLYLGAGVLPLNYGHQTSDNMDGKLAIAKHQQFPCQLDGLDPLGSVLQILIQGSDYEMVQVYLIIMNKLIYQQIIFIFPTCVTAWTSFSDLTRYLTSFRVEDLSSSLSLVNGNLKHIITSFILKPISLSLESLSDC